MPEPLTAEDLLPLIAKLSSEERRRLIQLMIRQGSTSAEVHTTGDLTSDKRTIADDPLGWEADGWESTR